MGMAAVPVEYAPRPVADGSPAEIRLHEPFRITTEVSLSTNLYVALLVLAFGAGAIVRVLPLLGSSFPIGDGGLFFAMVRELRANHFALPHLVSYNGDHFPYAYPPLAFYLTAGLWTLTGASPETIFRVVPLAFSLASIG